MKKMAVGNKNRSESSRRRGELLSNVFNLEDNWRFFGGRRVFWPSKPAAFYARKLANVGIPLARANSRSLLARDGEGQHQSSSAKACKPAPD